MAEISLGLTILGEAASTRLPIDIQPARPRPNPEPVSQRFKSTLIHPQQENFLCGLRFSPDGKQIVAGDYPAGVVQIWDVETGKQLRSFETSYDRQYGLDYFAVSPDWQKIYALRRQRKLSRFERDGKKMLHQEYTGEVREWDLRTGEQLDSFKHDPPRGIATMRLSPNGAMLLTGEYLTCDSDSDEQSSGSLRYLDSKSYRTLPKRTEFYGIFSPDSAALAVGVFDKDYVTAIKIFDPAAFTEKAAIPVLEKNAWVYLKTFSADGRKLIGTIQAFTASDRSTSQSALKVWDTQSGKELVSISADEAGMSFTEHSLSPDGRLLAVANWRSAQPCVYVLDLEGNTLAARIDLGPPADEASEVTVRDVQFSPDGKWIAASTQRYPKPENGVDVSAADFEQTRVYLVEVASRLIRETIVSPPGNGGELSFSPDGKTLATTGLGSVHLWDLSTPPGGR